MMTLLELRELRDVLDYLPLAPKWLASRDVPRAEVENAIHIVDQAIREALREASLGMRRTPAGSRARVMGETIQALRQPILPNHSPRLARDNADTTENEGFAP